MTTGCEKEGRCVFVQDSEVSEEEPSLLLPPSRAGKLQKQFKNPAYYPMSFHASMLIYYLQSIARSLKLSSQQLRMQIQNASII